MEVTCEDLVWCVSKESVYATAVHLDFFWRRGSYNFAHLMLRVS